LNIFRKTKLKLVAFILSNNSHASIEYTVSKLPNIINDFFISEDSKDKNILNIANRKNYRLIYNQNIGGYGSNVKNSLRYAFNELKADYAIEVHGDHAQFDPSATYDAIEYLKNDYDFISGSRFLKFRENMRFGYPLERMIPNFFISNIERIILKIPLSDFHQGFKIYSRNFFQKMDLNYLSNDFLFNFETILLSKQLKLKIAEVPVVANYNLPHTSHKLFGKNSAFTYQIKTFKLIYKYLKNGKI
tara:strand:+ start:864 stop:1601 length:738 start_codon:yes stop_codon:yes gene_type:complete